MSCRRQKELFMANTAVARNNIESNTETVETFNPATGELLKKFKPHSKKEAEAIIESSHQAFLKWRQTSISERTEIIRKIGQEIERSKDELAKMMSQQMGKSIKESEGEIDLCVEICKYTADNGPALLESETRPLSQGGEGEIVYQPTGVILAMQPWNFPLYQVVRYSIPNLLAGNTTVLKHAEIVWGTAQKIHEIYEKAGLPQDVFSVAYVGGKVADELISHPRVKGVTFTGSAEVGKLIAEEAGKHLKKSLLELGGSDPYIILDDADLDLAVKTCVTGRISNAGQICIGAKRFIVAENLYDEFKDRFVKAMSQVSYGDPMDRNNDMGPMSSESARNNLHKQVQESIKKGAKCLTGGELPNGKGYFYPATVLENVKPGSPAYDEELFGPVAVLFKAKDEKEALKIANDHEYGLGGGVFSKDIERAKRVAMEIETGMVNINGYALSQPNMPFGGVKNSGYGREHGGFGLREFVNIKSILKPN